MFFGFRGRKLKEQRRKEKNKKKEGIYTKASTTKNKRNPRQKQKGIHGKNKKESTAETKRIPHKIGGKEGQFVHKSKDLRSNILMQT